MDHDRRTQRNFTPEDRAAAKRVQAALSATKQAGPPRRRFVWNFLAGLSALALGIYHPAMPSDVRAEDWKPTPREPEQDNNPWNPVGKRDDQRRSWRPDWKQDIYRTPPPTIRVAANEEVQEGGAKQRFDIPAGELEEGLISFSKHTGIQSLYPSDLVAGRRTQGLQGDYTPEEALQGILTGNRLVVFVFQPRHGHAPTDGPARSHEPGRTIGIGCRRSEAD